MYTGLTHIPVCPLTSDQEKLALAAAQMSATPTFTDHTHQDTPTHEEEGSRVSGVYKGGSNKTTKAFSGKGHTLSSGSSEVGGVSDVGGASENSARKVQRSRVVVAKQLADLQSREKDLQNQVCEIFLCHNNHSFCKVLYSG